MIGITSFKLSRLPHLAAFLHEDDYQFVTPWNIRKCADFVGWGYKTSGMRAQKLARSHNLPCTLMEDGFLRSVGPSDPPLSITFERDALYYDATRPGQLDTLLNQSLSPSQAARASCLIAKWRQARVSKYNHTREFERNLPTPYILVVDQIRGDASIRHGLGDASSFQNMLKAALADNPHCSIIVKSHPLVANGKTIGNIHPAAHTQNPRLHFITEPCSPVRLMQEAEAVYTVTSQLGFEALLHNKPVKTFGMPFYAGRGLTQDLIAPPKWRRTVSLNALVHAALIAYPHYVDPETGLPCDVERVIDHLSLQKVMHERFPANIHAIGFSIWKKRHLRRFMAGSTLHFVRSEAQVPSDTAVAVWGNIQKKLKPTAKIIRIEDGFLRSAGLGTDLVRPLSWTCDDIGIHYDPNHPSRLETLLATTIFDESTLRRAKHLRQHINAVGITKYNLRGTHWSPPKSNTRIILVPGQVEDDASLQHGAVDIRTNLQLAKTVRQANPDAWLIYKPHPDVVARLRKSGADETEIASYCDEIRPDVSIISLLHGVDEVHTITSLTGFEALLRGKQVTCYGRPFYAGWGLTTDLAPLPNRQRQLTLDELVAATLILYPTYVSARTNHYTTPERVIDELGLQSSTRARGELTATMRPFLRFMGKLRPNISQQKRLI